MSGTGLKYGLKKWMQQQCIEVSKELPFLIKPKLRRYAKGSKASISATDQKNGMLKNTIKALGA